MPIAYKLISRNNNHVNVSGIFSEVTYAHSDQALKRNVTVLDIQKAQRKWFVMVVVKS